MCGGDLDSLESFSRSWATGFGARCSSYESCFGSALTRHSDAVREAEASVVRWRKSWLAVARMECMAKTIDGSGAVDQANMHTSNDKNITDMSFLNLTIEKPPARLCVPLQKFILDRHCTEKKSMANFRLASACVSPRFALCYYIPRFNWRSFTAMCQFGEPPISPHTTIHCTCRGFAPSI